MKVEKNTLNNILIHLNKSQIQSLNKCLLEAIMENNKELSKCDFFDEEDIEHWNMVNDYNENLKKIREIILRILKQGG